MSSLRNARPRCVSTVFSVTNSVCAISRLVPPFAASSATRSSLAVSESGPAPSIAAGPDADRRKLDPGPALQRAGAAPGGPREAVEQRFSRGCSLPGGAERRAEVNQHTSMLESRRRIRQHRERRRQSFGALRRRADERLRAQRDADRSRGAERLRALYLVGGERLGLAVAAELGQRQGRG